MKKTPFDDVPDVYLETIRKRKKEKNPSYGNFKRKKTKSSDNNSNRQRFDEFMKQEITTDDFYIIPPEYFSITLFVLFITIPKALGMGFFFFYLAGGKYDLYDQVHTGGYLLDWAIGYEILAAIAILMILKKLLTYVFD